MNKIKVLIVDDEENIRNSLTTLLELEKFEVVTASNGKVAVSILEKEVFNAAIVDLKMPELDGHGLLQWIMDRGMSLPVMMISAHGQIQDAVMALTKGAKDYLIKPFDPEELLLRLKSMVSHDQALHNLEIRDRTDYSLSIPIIEEGRTKAQSKNRKMFEIYDSLSKASQARAILIQGESGTGKEVLAKQIHGLSTRTGSFVPVNLGAVPEQLLESELFGHEKGAFTGAQKLRRGIFELAQAGTVFLDEIGEMPYSLQVKLLRVLQERSIRRVGGEKDIPCDFLLIAATNANLEEMVKANTFREDLFYRLNVFSLNLPSLRERMEDFEDLCTELSKKLCRILGRPSISLSKEAINHLKMYHFPGNIRELENILERAILLSKSAELNIKDFSFLGIEGNEHSTKNLALLAGAAEDLPTDQATVNQSLMNKEREQLRSATSMEDFEKIAIVRALKKHNGNRTHAATELKISRRSLIDRLHRYDLS